MLEKNGKIILWLPLKHYINIVHKNFKDYIEIYLQEKILLIFFSSIKIRPEYNELIKIFLKDFNTIIDEYFKNLVDNYRSLEVEIIYKRVDFEEKFKFKTNYNDLLENYENERKRLLTKKKSITDTIDNYSRTLETFKSRIYNLENQNVIIRQNK